MALLYDTDISPSKDEVLAGFVPGQAWTAGVDTSTWERIGAFRFDDPDGEVGIETFLLRAADGAVLQVPLTYRGAPLPDVEAITTMEHGVLGTRWIYDGPHDPVYVTAVLHAIMTGGHEAEQQIERDGRTQPYPTSVRVHGTGNARVATPAEGSYTVADEPGRTVVTVPGVVLELARVVRDGAAETIPIRLLAEWDGLVVPAVLAVLRQEA